MSGRSNVKWLAALAALAGLLLWERRRAAAAIITLVNIGGRVFREVGLWSPAGMLV